MIFNLCISLILSKETKISEALTAVAILPWALNVFDEIVALTGYSQIGQTILIYNYTPTFSFLNFGLGSAITYIIILG